LSNLRVALIVAGSASGDAEGPPIIAQSSLTDAGDGPIDDELLDARGPLFGSAQGDTVLN
jgi:hypothetical protein